MTFAELVAAFEAYTGVIGEIDDADMAVWFNEAQLDLAMDFGTIKTATLIPDSDGIVAPPADSIKVIGADGDFAWDSMGHMVFPGRTEVKVYYRAMPDPTHVFTGADPDQTPDLPYAMHYLLALFATAMYWDRESEGDTEEMALANKWLTRYQMMKKTFLSKMDQAGGRVDRWIIVED